MSLAAKAAAKGRTRTRELKRRGHEDAQRDVAPAHEFEILKPGHHGADSESARCSCGGWAHSVFVSQAGMTVADVREARFLALFRAHLEEARELEQTTRWVISGGMVPPNPKLEQGRLSPRRERALPSARAGPAWGDPLAVTVIDALSGRAVEYPHGYPNWRKGPRPRVLPDEVEEENADHANKKG